MGRSRSVLYPTGRSVHSLLAAQPFTCTILGCAAWHACAGWHAAFERAASNPAPVHRNYTAISAWSFPRSARHIVSSGCSSDKHYHRSDEWSSSVSLVPCRPNQDGAATARTSTSQAVSEQFAEQITEQIGLQASVSRKQITEQIAC